MPETPGGGKSFAEKLAEITADPGAHIRITQETDGLVPVTGCYAVELPVEVHKRHGAGFMHGPGVLIENYTATMRIHVVGGQIRRIGEINFMQVTGWLPNPGAPDNVQRLATAVFGNPAVIAFIQRTVSSGTADEEGESFG